MRSGIFKIIISICIVLFGGSSILFKDFIGEHIFKSVVYPNTIEYGHVGVNTIQVLNRAWFGKPVPFELEFPVSCTSIGDIYIRNYSEDLYNTNPADPKKQYTVYLFSNSSDLEIKPPIKRRDDSFMIHAKGKIAADDCLALEIIWINNEQDHKELNPALRARSRQCNDFSTRPFYIRYHLIPAFLFFVAAFCLGGLVGLTIPQSTPKEIVPKIDTPLSMSLLDIYMPLNKINKEIDEIKNYISKTHSTGMVDNVSTKKNQPKKKKKRSK